MSTNRFAISSATQLSAELGTLLALCSTTDSPRSLAIKLMVENKEWEQLARLSIRPSDYEDPSNYAEDSLVTELLRKSPNLPVEDKRYQRAVDSFYESEQRCKLTNERLFADQGNPVLWEVRRQVQKILGPLTAEALASIEENFGFGPGATTGVTGKGSVLSDKYDEEIHLTSNLLPFYRAILGDRWWEVRKHPTLVDGNKFTTVPKTSLIDRGICIEPTLNIYVQKGIGAYIRKRLKRFGFDLDTQAHNRDLAKRAYAEKLATIDLAAASDTIATSVIFSTLDEKWFELLRIARSPTTTIEGETVVLEKFSSMGNGYTFELESLIFAAVVLASTTKADRETCAVYGDDIIVPQDKAHATIETLEFLGFSVNSSKSFLAGNFFESCGEDYFKGVNVRPIHLKGKDEKSSRGIPYTLQIANKLRLYLWRRSAFMGCDKKYQPLWEALHCATPHWARACLVPPSMGDAGFIVSNDEIHDHRSRDWWEGWHVRRIVMKPEFRDKRSFGLLLSVLAACRPNRLDPLLDRYAADYDIDRASLLSYGREPKRGYLRKPVTKLGHVYSWPIGLEWVDFSRSGDSNIEFEGCA